MSAPAVFRRHRLRSEAQWGSGLFVRLRPCAGGGATLFSRPTVVAWLPTGGAATDGALALEDCGQVFWVDPRDCGLCSLDPRSGGIRRLTRIGDGRSCDVTRLRVGPTRLRVFDRGRERVAVLWRESLQVLWQLVLEGLRDVAGDADGAGYALCDAGVVEFDARGRVTRTLVAAADLPQPRALALAPGGRALFVLGHEQLLRLDLSQGTRSLAELPPECRFDRPLFAADEGEQLFAAEQGGSWLHALAPDGSLLERFEVDERVRAIHGLAAGAAGKLLLATDAGLALLDVGRTAVGAVGSYYTRTLDLGSTEEERWHRLDLEAVLPEGTTLDVSYASDESPALAEWMDRTVADPSIGAVEKERRIEERLHARWIGPDRFRTEGAAVVSPDMPQRLSMLFREDTKRHLWLRLDLGSFDPDRAPRVLTLDAVRPRTSYLRYLPAVYQDDPRGRAFLERFLSIFETIFQGLDDAIDVLFRYLDPLEAPTGFLPWLADWLAVALDEDWDEATKRAFVQRADALHRAKGTPAGITELVGLVTGRGAMVLEHDGSGRPLVLGGAARLGFDSLLRAQPPRGFRLGDSAVLGHTALRAETQRADDPFLGSAHRFTLLLDLDREGFARHERSLRRVLAESVPAHVRFDLRLSAGAGVGGGVFVGLNARVAGPRPFQVGISTVGHAHAVMRPGGGAQLERNTNLSGGLPLL